MHRRHFRDVARSGVMHRLLDARHLRIGNTPSVIEAGQLSSDVAGADTPDRYDQRRVE